MKKPTAYITTLLLIFTVLFAGEGLDLEKQLLDQGMVNIQSLSPDILVELKYSSTDNFLSEDTYGDLEACYLQPKAARMLAEAQKLLKSKDPKLTLLIYDGVRPRSIQRKMWKLVYGTEEQDYVANPERGSVHNFGFAVDLTIASMDGTPLDMGTPFDYFGELAQPRYEERFLKEGKLTKQQIANRQMFREVMLGAGFQAIKIEWWHFNALPVKEARAYRIVE